MNTSIVFHEIAHYSATMVILRADSPSTLPERRAAQQGLQPGPEAPVTVHQVVRHAHRDAAQQALADAQRNPVLSAEQSFAAAQVHALLAIEARIGELVDADRA
jgi:hypothetical protein